jgi:light-regulated signal transduction histidine kinase (bacteriophytochrome)
VQASPAFGQADLTNCERELIHLAGSVQPFGVLLTLQGPRFTLVQASTNTASLLGAAASFRDLVGYDRVMVYKFDPDGHGKIIAEARDPRLESLLGHHYPATDIPQRARELYLRNRLRVLVDVDYEAAALVPRQLPGPAMGELDMSMCHLRSMSPLHLQYLRNMGVTATLVVSLVREGKLWGLMACHHYSPRNLRCRCAPPATCWPRSFHTHRRDRELRPCPGRDPGAPARAAPDRGHLHRRRLAPGPVPQPAHAAATAGAPRVRHCSRKARS